MNKQIIELLQENNRLLNEINNKLSNQPSVQTYMSGEGVGVGVMSTLGLPKEVLTALAEQYRQNPDIVIQENAVARFQNGNLTISSSKGRVNVNLLEKDAKSSFIKTIAQRGQKLIVTFKSGKTYQYTSNNMREFNRVADMLMNATYVSHPFLQNLRSNPEFDYAVVS